MIADSVLSFPDLVALAYMRGANTELSSGWHLLHSVGYCSIHGLSPIARRGDGG